MFIRSGGKHFQRLLWHWCVFIARHKRYSHCDSLPSIFKSPKAGRALDRIGSARFSPAWTRRTSTHCFGAYRHQKTHKTFRLEADIGLPHALDLRNILLCPVFRNCSDTCRRGLCRADVVRGIPFVSTESYLCGLCRSVPSRADPIQCAPSLRPPPLTANRA
jgi:hypothetical protein